jgi:Glycoside hydrolase 123, catalytic domain
LRWAYDAWPADPVRDSRHVLWPSGDCFMIYPGGGSSIRFEKMREGIVDFEKLKILRNKAAKSTDPAIKNLVQQLEQHLKIFTLEREFKEEKLLNDIQKGRQLVEELSEKLR